MKYLDETDIEYFCVFLSQQLNVNRDSIVIYDSGYWRQYISNDGLQHPYQMLRITSTDEQKIEEIMKNKLLIPYGIQWSASIYRVENTYSFVISLFDEQDCMTCIEIMKQPFVNYCKILFPNNMGKPSFEQVQFCKENNYWTTYQIQVLK